MTHTTVTRRRPTRPGAPIDLRALDFGDADTDAQEQELLASLEESGDDLRKAIAVLARIVSGVMYGGEVPLNEAIDLLEQFDVLVPEFGRALGIAA
jgi:hypothetical protein